MLRYRVAVMLWLFLVIGASAGGGLAGTGWRMLWAVLVLAATYVAATSVNDIADEPIDRVNHPMDPDRPLVTGAASPLDLWRLHAAVAGFAVVASIPLGSAAVLLAVGALGIGWAYSLRPMRLSHRGLAAPLTLALAYAGVPFALGLVVAGGSWSPTRVGLALGLALLFTSRIVLKDFRDRRGDALYGRATVLLRFGKSVTCAISLGALALGNAVLVAATDPPWTFLLLIEAFVAGILTRLYALWRAEDGPSEQLAIGLGARLGNGLLVMVAGWLALEAEGAAEVDRLLFGLGIAIVFGASFLLLATRPERAVIGYKG